MIQKVRAIGRARIRPLMIFASGIESASARIAPAPSGRWIARLPARLRSVPAHARRISPGSSDLGPNIHEPGRTIRDREKDDGRWPGFARAIGPRNGRSGKTGRGKAPVRHCNPAGDRLDW